MTLTIFIQAFITIFLTILSFKLFQKLTELKKQNQGLVSKYGVIINLDEHRDSLIIEKAKIEVEISTIQNQYREKKAIFDALVKEVAIYNEEIAIAEWGIYKPHFDFDTTEKFKNAIKENHQKQKDHFQVELEKLKEAVGRDSRWNEHYRLTNFAFNQACDSAIANVRWNNIERMEERIKKVYKLINVSYEVVGRGKTVKINDSEMLLNIKLDELRLTHEYEMKKKAEKDEQTEIRRQMREDAKLEEDLTKAQAEEEKYQKLLAKAKKEAEKAVGEKEKVLEAKIAMLTQELSDAQIKTERAKSLAEQTKRGHIYVISNKGSFGDEVYKIGMTRRLDPQDRIDELGDASVPFRFDVHAVIYTEDAPTLEKALHKELEARRLNLVNYRKEFFKVELTAIQELVKQKHPNVEFILTAEAKEYNESLAIRSAAEKQEMEGDSRIKFPVAI